MHLTFVFSVLGFLKEDHGPTSSPVLPFICRHPFPALPLSFAAQCEIVQHTTLLLPLDVAGAVRVCCIHTVNTLYIHIDVILFQRK